MFPVEEKSFCDADLLWTHDLSDTEKLVYAVSICEQIKSESNDLVGEGFSDLPSLYKLTHQGYRWIVEQDNRTTSSKEPITQDWVKEAEKIVPQDFKNKCSPNCFSTEGVIDQAAEYYNLPVPQYPLNFCNSDSDCSSDSICVLSGVANAGPHTCVKKCNFNRDCGAAHICAARCVKGEKSCSETAVKVCFPSTLSPDLKDPNGFIKAY